MKGLAIRHGARRGDSSSGQALVEFAVVVPVFLSIFFAIVQLSLAASYSQIVANAAREGARYAIVHGSEALCPSGPMPTLTPNPCDPTGARVTDAVRRALYGIGNPGALVVTTEWRPDNGRGSTVRVAVTYPFRPQILFLQLPEFTIREESTLVINH